MKKLLILVILVLALFLRLYKLDAVPNGLTWDEASLGYNAYSILKTGKDEHGTSFPIIFKSFGDFKPGAYVYLTIPSVALLGLNEFSVRLPSVFFGLLGIVAVYILIQEVHPGKPKEKKIIGLLSSFVLATMPWAVHFSRGAWEVNVFVTVLLFSIIFYLRFLNGKSSLWPSLILASSTFVIYQAAKILTPLVFLFLLVLYKKQSLTALAPYFSKKKIIYFLPFVVFALWLAYGVFFGSTGNRLATLNIFNYKPIKVNQYFENQPLLTFNLITSRYFYHFSPEVLFYEGERITERAHIPGSGLLNPVDFVFLIGGIFYLVNLKKSKFQTLVLGLLLLSPIPASLTLAEFSPLRALFMIVPLSIIVAAGAYQILKLSKLLFVFLSAGYLLLTVYIFDLYIFHSQSVFALEFNYGHKEVVEIIKANPTKKVLFTDVYGQPYIYYLFHTSYDPAKYQQENNFESGGLDVGKVSSVNNVYFQQFGTSELNVQKNTLFIGTEGNIDRTFDIAGDNISLFKQIETPDKKIIFRVVKTKDQ